MIKKSRFKITTYFLLFIVLITSVISLILLSIVNFTDSGFGEDSELIIDVNIIDCNELSLLQDQFQCYLIKTNKSVELVMNTDSFVEINEGNLNKYYLYFDKDTSQQDKTVILLSNESDEFKRLSLPVGSISSKEQIIFEKRGEQSELIENIYFPANSEVKIDFKIRNNSTFGIASYLYLSVNESIEQNILGQYLLYNSRVSNDDLSFTMQDLEGSHNIDIKADGEWVLTISRIENF